MSDEPDDEPPTMESLLHDVVVLEIEKADIKRELEQLSLDIDDLVWELQYRLKQGDVAYALDLLDRWD